MTLPRAWRLARLALVRAGILAALVATLALWAGGMLQPLGQRIVDARFQVWTRPASGKVAIAAIDTGSLARLGVWPWPREVHARLLDALLALGATQVAFDVDFSSRSTAPQDDQLAAALERADGKVLLAAMPEKQFDAWLAAAQLAPFTPKSIIDKKLLHAEIDRVRGAGVGYDDAEFDEEVRCIAAPILDFTGQIVGAIGISGPIWRMSLQRMDQMTQLVRQVASELSKELGYHS